VVLSGDGKWLVTGSADKTARLWELATGKQVRVFAGHASGIESLALSADGKWLVTGSWDKTARLWELAGAKEIRVFRGHGKRVSFVALSRDGKSLLTAGETTLRTWAVDTGRQVRLSRLDFGNFRSLALSGDGKWVAVVGFGLNARVSETGTGKERTILGDFQAVALSHDGKWLVTSEAMRTGERDEFRARLWETATGKEVRDFRGHSGWIGALVLSEDGKFLASGSGDNTARLWDLETGKEVRVFQGHSIAAGVSAGGKWLMTRAAATVPSFWELPTGKEFRAFRGRLSGVASAALSADGKWLVTGHKDKAVLWDLATGKQLRLFKAHEAAVISVAISKDGKWLASASEENVRAWEVATGKEVRIPIPKGTVYVGLSGDGKWLVTGGYSGENFVWQLWETARGKYVRFLGGHGSLYRVSTFSGWALPQHQDWLLSGNFDRTASIWELPTGKELRVFKGHEKEVSCLALSQDGKWLVTGSWDTTARLWEVATAKEVRTYRGHGGAVLSLVLSADGKRLLTSSEDHTIRVWDLATAKELCRLVSFRDGTWAVVDSLGRYDAANGGDIEGLHWVANNETIALKQLKERYYEPGLLAKYMGLEREPLREVEAFRNVDLAPKAVVRAFDRNSGKLHLALANRGGGIGKLQVFVNGRELLADARGSKFDPARSNAEVKIDLAGAPTLKPGEKNRVTIVTWNAAGYLSSRGLDLDWQPPGPKQEQPVELHVIAAGVSTYASEDLNLNFPGKDAHDMARALTAAGKRLFGADKVHLTLLCEVESARSLPPTRRNLLKAFEAARSTRPNDILVVYLAGHGIALTDKGQEIYCYLTKEARTTDRSAFRDPAVREHSSITSAELTDWFKRIPASKQVLILDTCAAGAAAGKLMEHREISADQIRAIDRLRDRTGFHVLMGCAANRVSYEASQFAQGLLTYALLQGMRGAALKEDKYVDVSRLFQYAADEVPLLARYIGGIQKPEVRAPKGTSFDIGLLEAPDKEAIPLARVRPLLLRPLLQNADEAVLDDDLGLMPLLRAKLREQSFAAARGSGRSLTAVYVDADEMPGAIRPSGKYTVTAGRVQVRLNLRRDGQTLAVIMLEGNRAQLADLAARLASAIAKKLKMP
jgi:WD40 repeat protein